MISLSAFAACSGSGGGGGGVGGTIAIAPNAPSTLSAVAVSGGGIALTWTDGSDNEDGFKVERSADSVTFTEVGTVIANIATYSEAGLTASTRYYYRVRAYNSTGNSDYSNTADATTLPSPVTAPAAPSNLSATAASSIAINLTWTDTSSNEEGFKIERSTSAGSGFAVIATVAANVANYSDSNLTSSTTYYYRVKAYNSAGESAYTAMVSTATQAPPLTAPAAPTSLVISSATSTLINLSWTDNSSDETGFKVEKSADGTTFAQLATVGANVVAYSDTGLTALTTYYYRVRAYNSIGNSSYSNTANATTQAPPLVSLSAVTALYPANGVNWNDYVKNDDVDIYSASDTACAGSETGGYSACLHGGEMRTVEVIGKSSCSGLTATDSLGAFTWICSAATGTAQFVSTGLKDGKYLSDLLDFTTPAWKPNAVTVFDNGTAYGKTDSTTWWTNPVVVNNTGGTLSSVGTVNVVTSNMTGNYIVGASRVALVSKPSITITGPGAGSGSSVVTADGLSTARDFFWFEGNVNAAGDDVAVSLNKVRFSVMRGVKANNANTGTGQAGVFMRSSSNNNLNTITTANEAIGVYLGSSSNNNTLRSISASNCSDSGILIISSQNNTLTSIHASNNGVGLYLSQTSGNTVTSVVTTSNGYGIQLNLASNNKINAITASNNSSVGVVLRSSTTNTLNSITASNNVDVGVYLDSSSDNALASISASNNSVDGVYLSSSSNNVLSSVTAANNGNDGVSLGSSSNNAITFVSTANNGGDGIGLISSPNNVISSVTAANNGYDGIGFMSSSNNILSSVTAANNTYYGVYLYSSSNHNTLTSVSAASDIYYSVYLDSSSYNKFTGVLQVGNNGVCDCHIVGGTVVGLVDITCANNGYSDSSLVTGITLASSFVGKVTADDTANASDTNGAATHDNISDWTGFQNPFRSWGKDGSAFPLGDNCGQCTTGTTCRIWDWSLANGNAVIKDVLLPPAGTNTLTHTWAVAPAPTNQAACNAAVPGSLFVTDHCETTFLRNAIDLSGNGNGLCESGDTCLYTPNIGAYQGHGNLVSAGTFTDGTISSVTLLKYEFNGR
jgi:parallel beta-helix repeat protein